MSFIIRQIFIAFLAIIISFIYFIYQTLPKNRLKYYHANYQTFNYISNITKIEEFDYIIVGGGTAGCILANRLSSDSNISVLLIEAGVPDDYLHMYIPSMYPKLFESEVSWQFYSNEKNNSKKIFIPQGKSLGGSSVLSRSIYQRGLKQDYESWKMLGFNSWNHEQFLQYFEKIEGFIGNLSSKENFLYGTTGEFKFSNIHNPHLLSKIIRNSLKEALNVSEKVDNDEQEILEDPYLSIIRGEKLNVASAYLTPQVLKRKNLWIRMGTIVNRILFDEDKRVIGVEIGNSDKLKTIIKCRREVIITAGAIGSPKLLMMSGIGDENHLKELNLSVIYNNTDVGRNLNDHPTINIIKTTKKGVSTLHHKNNFPHNLVDTFKWIFYKKNELCSNNAETIGYLSSDNNKIDLQVTIFPNLYEISRFDSSSIEGYSISLSLLNQTSRGNITLKSNSWKDKPKIELNFLTNKGDVDKLLEGLKKIEKSLDNKNLKEITQTSIFPRNENLTEENIKEDIINNVVSNYNLMSSCSMGKVVDENLRVIGVHGLRIADSSIIPVSIRGYLLSTVLVIAERCSDMILKNK